MSARQLLLLMLLTLVVGACSAPRPRSYDDDRWTYGWQVCSDGRIGQCSIIDGTFLHK